MYTIICTYHRLYNNGNKVLVSRNLYEASILCLQNHLTTKKYDKNEKDHLMMIIRWVANLFSRSHKLEWLSWKHKTSCIAKEIQEVIERTNYILDALSTEYIQQASICSSMKYKTSLKQITKDHYNRRQYMWRCYLCLSLHLCLCHCAY